MDIQKIREAIAFERQHKCEYADVLCDLAEKVLAVKMPEKKDSSKKYTYNTERDLYMTMRDEGWNDCLEQCALSFTGALLRKDEIEKALNQSWYDNYGDKKHPYSIELADAINKAQMEKLGGEK